MASRWEPDIRAAEQWHIKGELALSCNCAVFCPCVLSLGQQYYISKQNGAEIHLWKNMGIDKLLAWIAAKRSGTS